MAEILITFGEFMKKIAPMAAFAPHALEQMAKVEMNEGKDFNIQVTDTLYSVPKKSISAYFGEKVAEEVAEDFEEESVAYEPIIQPPAPEPLGVPEEKTEEKPKGKPKSRSTKK